MSASKIILEIVCPVAGVLMANIMFMAPFHAVKTAMKSGDLGDLNPAPWAFMTGNCIGWLVYAFLTSNLYLYFANAPGLLMSLWFNLVAVKLSHQHATSRQFRASFVGYFAEERRKSTLIAAVDDTGSLTNNEEGEADEEQSVPQDKKNDQVDLVDSLFMRANNAIQNTLLLHHERLIFVLVVSWFVIISIIGMASSSSSPFPPLLNAKQQQLLVGILVNCNLTFFYGAPLSTILRVIRTQSSASIHVGTMLTNTVNGSFWTAYGLAVQDPFIYVPNGLGTILGAIQITLRLLFPPGICKSTTNNQESTSHDVQHHDGSNDNKDNEEHEVEIDHA